MTTSTSRRDTANKLDDSIWRIKQGTEGINNVLTHYNEELRYADNDGKHFVRELKNIQDDLEDGLNDLNEFLEELRESTSERYRSELKNRE